MESSWSKKEVKAECEGERLTNSKANVSRQKQMEPSKDGKGGTAWNTTGKSDEDEMSCAFYAVMSEKPFKLLTWRMKSVLTEMFSLSSYFYFTSVWADKCCFSTFVESNEHKSYLYNG